MGERRWRIAVGSDSVGLPYKDIIKEDLESDDRVISVVDVGVNRADTEPARYPSIGHRAAELVAAGEVDRAMLICGTGIGMAISANQVEGVWATVAHDSYSVERSILSNDCQVLTLGQRVVGIELARRLVQEWLDYAFDPSSHSRANVVLVEEYEQPNTGLDD
jgi:ribose 5-phosphate isomerase B